MSSTVGYGIEVTGDAFGEPVAAGDWEEELASQFPELAIARSRPEYSDEEDERVFVLIKTSVVKAGGSSQPTAAFGLEEPDPIILNMFLAESKVKKVGLVSWKLVDYYVYS